MSPSPHLTPEEQARIRRYALVIEWSDVDEVFIASAPDLPGLATHGRTREEAAAMGEDAIAVWLYGDDDPPAARFTAMRTKVRPEAEPAAELVAAPAGQSA